MPGDRDCCSRENTVIFASGWSLMCKKAFSIAFSLALLGGKTLWRFSLYSTSVLALLNLMASRPPSCSSTKSKTFMWTLSRIYRFCVSRDQEGAHRL